MLECINMPSQKETLITCWLMFHTSYLHSEDKDWDRDTTEGKSAFPRMAPIMRAVVSTITAGTDHPTGLCISVSLSTTARSRSLTRTGGYFNTTPSKAEVWSNTGAGKSVVEPSGSVISDTYNTQIGALFSWDNETAISSRVGISYISVAQACNNVNNEIPAGTALQTVVEDTKEAWNTKVLSKISTTSSDSTNLELLYTSLYFMNILPTNLTGENPGWNSTEPYYSDIFTLWDLFRCGTSLFHVIQPTAYEEYIRSLIDIFRFEGYMPDARSSNYNGRVQGGSNADNVLADAFVKGVRGGVDWEDGYAAMVKDAEVTPNNTVPPDPMAPDSSTKEGRGALPDWLQYGFITPTYSRAASRAVEYSYNDFSLYQVAKGLGKDADAEKYLNRSRNWRNHWNPALESIGYSGFIVPRDVNGFIETDPLTDSGYWGDPYYEVGHAPSMCPLGVHRIYLT